MGGRGGYFEKLAYGSETKDITSEGLGEISEGDFSEIYAEKYPIVSMGGRVDLSTVRRWGTLTPISASKY